MLNNKVHELTVVPAKNNKNFYTEFEEIFPINEKRLKAIGAEKRDKTRFQMVQKEVAKLYAAKEEEIDPEIMRKI